MRESSEEVRARPGEAFEVSLAEPAATGHRWELAEGGDDVTVLDDRYEPPDRSRGLGAPGRRVIRVRPERPGRHRLKWVLVRGGEADSAAEHRVELDAAP